MLYNLLIVFSSFIYDYAFRNGHIDHLTDLLNDLLNILHILTRYVIKLANIFFNFLCKLIGCEAQEGAE